MIDNSNRTVSENNREYAAFRIMAEAAVHGKDLPDLCHRVLRGLMEVLRFDSGTLRLYDAQREILEPMSAAGLGETDLASISEQSIHDHRLVAAHVARTLTPIYAPDVYENAIYGTHRERIDELGIRSLISWPLLGSDQRLIGVLQLLSTHERIEFAEEPPFFRIVAEMLTTVLERQFAIAALHVSESRYRTLLENLPVGIFRSTPEGLILSVNPAIVNMLGYDSADELRRVPAVSLYSDTEQRERLMKCLEIENIAERFEVEMKRKDGSRFWGEMSIRAVSSNDHERVHHDGILLDITERKTAAQALRESEGKYRTLVEQSLQGISIATGMPARILFANKALATMLGYSVEEFLALPPEELASRIYEEDRRLFWGNYAKRIAGEDVPSRYEFRAVRKDGAIRWVEVYARRIEFGGEPAVQAAYMDITERKQMESELIKTQKLDSIGVLAGGIAHDFNNLLTGVIGNISLTKELIDSDTPARKRLEEGEMAALRARNLTQQLLTFAKGGDPVKRVAALTPVIRETAFFALSGSASNCEFDIASDLRPVEFDEGQMIQVINNLVINADQASPKGGVIKITASNEMVDGHGASRKRPGLYVRIDVEDEGVGIPPDHLRSIFDPYFTTKQEGSGLGLAIVYSIVEKHEGFILVDSVMGNGSTFSVYLPASEEFMPIADPDDHAIIVGNGRILVMDDEEIVRDIAAEMLTMVGYSVTAVTDGEAALKAYSDALDDDKRFDLVLMDLTVRAGTGGREAMRRLMILDPGVRAVVLSGYANDPIMSSYRNYGFVGAVSKPFQLPLLARTVHDALRGS